MTRLFLLITLIPAFANAQNIVQFTGGNYVFVEQDKLTFNLDHKIFLSRNWTYDPATDSANAYFKVNLRFKTRHASDFWGYDAALGSQYHTVAMQSRAAQWQQQYQIRPVYRQKVFLPAAGWFIGVGGTVLRSVLPGAMMTCLRSVRCSVLSTSVAAHAIGICQFHIHYGLPLVSREVSLPGGICRRAEADGYQKDQDGVYKRQSTYTVQYNSNAVAWYGAPSDAQHYPTLAAARSAIKSILNCNSPPNNWALHEVVDSSHAYSCVFDSRWNGNYSATAYISPNNQQSELTMVDISNYAAEDFKESPNDYINAPGPLGEELRAKIMATEASIKNNSGQGTFSVYSSVYRTPNGNVVQDQVTVTAAQPEPNPQPSGDKSSKAPGVSNTYNNVNVTHINRPDKEADSKPAENNNPNGNSPGVGGAAGGGGSDEGQEEGKGCEEGDDSLACAKLGDVQEGDNPFGIPTEEDGTFWQPDFFLPSNGVCPAPKVFTFMGNTYEISYEPICDVAQKLRYLFIALAAMTAGFIIFGRKGD